MSIHHQYRNHRGNFAGHATGDGFTIVWDTVPMGDFKDGTSVYDIIGICAERLEYLIDNGVATDNQSMAFFYLTSALSEMEKDDETERSNRP